MSSSKVDLFEIKSALGRDGFFISTQIDGGNLREIGESLGGIRVDKRNPDSIRNISPQEISEASQNTLSSRFGTSEFPFHTDTAHWEKPARYLLLYCLSPGCGGRPTLLQDTRLWKLTSQEHVSLTNEVWKTAYFRPHLCTVGQDDGDHFNVRFDMSCMAPMTTRSHELKAFLEEKIAATRAAAIIWSEGMTLIISNQRMLHARGKASSPDGDRVIKRMLMGGN